MLGSSEGRKLAMKCMAAGSALCLLALLALTPAAPQRSELVGGVFMGGVPPEGVLDDLSSNVDPSDPYGGPVWGLQSGDIGSTYEYAAPRQAQALAGQSGPANMQQLLGFNLGYEHHEQPPIFMGGSARRNSNVQLAQQAAKEMQLWGWPSAQKLAKAQQKTNGGKAKAVQPSANAKKQQLWGWNLGYEHHEQKPLFFGSIRKDGNPKLAQQEARQMQLWGWPTSQATQGATRGSAAPRSSAAKKQQLWMWNMGYEHHEQTPVSMWPARGPRNAKMHNI